MIDSAQLSIPEPSGLVLILLLFLIVALRVLHPQLRTLWRQATWKTQLVIACFGVIASLGAIGISFTYPRDQSGMVWFCGGFFGLMYSVLLCISILIRAWWNRR
jgi:hypothetical protein